MTDTNFRRRLGRRPLAVITAAALLAVGGGAGALAVGVSRPSVTMAPATPVAIRSLTDNDNGIVTVRGRVAEIFGNKFVMADGSGRALIELGREGEDGKLVATGEPVTVQGRFDHGSIHAAFLVKADGKVTALGPLGGPHGRRDGPGPDGRPDGRGPAGRDAPPPPPAPVDAGAASAAVAPAPAAPAPTAG